MIKKLNIILANATVNNGNRGCVALCYASIYLIDMILTEAGMQYCLYLADSGQDKNGSYSINVAGKDISYIHIRHVMGISWKSYIKQLVCYTGMKNAISYFIHSDYILDIGQGDSFSDIYGKSRFTSINLIHREAKKYHKPYCLLPQTIGPFNNSDIKIKAVDAIEGADLVMTRDRQSFDYVREIAPLQKKVKEYIDVAFFLPYKKKKFNKNKIHVGLNISALLWHGGYTRNNQFGLKLNYPSLIRQVIDYFLSLKNVQLHLIPHVVGGEREIENDYAVSYDLCEEYDNINITLSPLFFDPVSAKSYIAGMDFFIGARMHATIAAFSSGVPVVPMAYSRKFNGLFIETLDYPYLVDLKVDQIENDVITKIKNVFEHRDILREKIKQQNETVVEEKKKLLIRDLKFFFHIS
jgi:polysaccharide pyruvyl transferase WcaK-like protein